MYYSWVMSSFNIKFYIFLFRYIYAFLLFIYRWCRFYSSFHYKRHRICYPSVDTTIIICFCFYLFIFIIETVISFASIHICYSKTSSEFYSFHCWYRIYKMRKNTFYRIKIWLSYSSWQSCYSSFQYSSY